jgi:serine/threonine protein kinase
LGDKYPQLLPRVFFAEPCDTIVVPKQIQNSDLMEEARIYYIQHTLLPSVLSKREIKRLEVEYRETRNKALYDSYWDGKLPAWLLFSELGATDLSTWREGRHTVAQWETVLDNVAAALDVLRVENITHNDLHHGNILLMPDGRATLIDFGEALETYEDGRDADKFQEGFLYVQNRPKAIRVLVTANHKC